MQTEKDFQAQVLEVAKLNGWLIYHTYDSRRSSPGFPDLVLVKPPLVVFAEIKSDAGKVTPAQDGWLGALSGCSEKITGVWRPSDWDEIVDVLSGRHKGDAQVRM